jgi:hypothetical protein
MVENGESMTEEIFDYRIIIATIIMMGLLSSRGVTLYLEGCLNNVKNK